MSDDRSWDGFFVTEDDVAPFVAEDVLATAGTVLLRVNERVAEVWGGQPVGEPPSHVVDVAIEAACRILDNPRGRGSTTSSTDGTSVTDRFAQTSGPRRPLRVGLTAGEKVRIRGRGRRRIGTVRTPPRY